MCLGCVWVMCVQSVATSQWYRLYRAGHKTLETSGSDVSPVSGWHHHREHHAMLLLRLCDLCVWLFVSDQTDCSDISEHPKSVYTLKALQNTRQSVHRYLSPSPPDSGDGLG